jgi:hypothetical protein
MVKLFFLLVANLLLLAGLWWLVHLGVGRLWLPVGYDVLAVATGAVGLSQLLVLALWSSLSEPRSPWRWIGLVGLCGLVSTAVSVAFYSPHLWQFTGRRFGFSWGFMFWQCYVTFMLVLSACIALLIAADVVMWPLRRILGCRIALEGHLPRTPAARGFGLTELFWWVAMAAAGCWLLRAILENVLAENLAVSILILICVVPVALPAAFAAVVERKRRAAFIASLTWGAVYSGGTAAVIWIAIETGYSPQHSFLAYLAFLPPELVVLAIGVAFVATYSNGWALRRAGIRLHWEIPVRSKVTDSA